VSNEKLIAHWHESSDKNYDDMLAIYKSKRYDWALYIGHLCLEKLLKALYIKVTGKRDVHYIHNLVKLAVLCNLETSKEVDRKLATVNEFNVEAKYQIEKQNFYKMCTKEYTKEQIEVIKELREWLKQELIK